MHLYHSQSLTAFAAVGSGTPIPPYGFDLCRGKGGVKIKSRTVFRRGTRMDISHPTSIVLIADADAKRILEMSYVQN